MEHTVVVCLLFSGKRRSVSVFLGNQVSASARRSEWQGTINRGDFAGRIVELDDVKLVPKRNYANVIWQKNQKKSSPLEKPVENGRHKALNTSGNGLIFNLMGNDRTGA